MSRRATPEQAITRGDGQEVGHAAFGAPDGHPVLYCHGTPGSRMEAALLDAPARRHGLRVIGLERPGYGRTAPRPGRAAGDEIDDVVAVIEHLGLERFNVIGFSGGGPQALACAAALPDRVERLSLVSSLAPFDEVGTEGMLEGFRALWQLARTDPEACARALRDAIDRAGGAWEMFLDAAPEADRVLLQDPAIGPPYRAALVEALEQDLAGLLEDVAAVVAWSPDPTAVQCPARVLHGTSDGNAPVAMGRWLAAQLPQAELTEWPGAAHFEFFRRADEVLAGHARVQQQG